MGACISTAKVSISNSSNNNNNAKETTPKPHKTTTKFPQQESSSSNNNPQRPRNRRGGNENNQKNPQQKQKEKEKPLRGNNARRQGGIIPCGKRTDFGYAKNFDRRYTIGKLLGHGQFGYTYVATDKANGDRVAVKRIEKNKVGI